MYKKLKENIVRYSWPWQLLPRAKCQWERSETYATYSWLCDHNTHDQGVDSWFPRCSLYQIPLLCVGQLTTRIILYRSPYSWLLNIITASICYEITIVHSTVLCGAEYLSSHLISKPSEVYNPNVHSQWTEGSEKVNDLLKFTQLLEKLGRSLS